MYTIVISVPFRRITQDRCDVASDWAKSLLLLRNSFNGHFGTITVAAPELPPGIGSIGQQIPQSLSEHNDDIRFLALGDTRWRARQFWRHYPRIRAKCSRLAQTSHVVHAGTGHLWQPFAYLGFTAACRAGTATVFVQDGDVVQRIRDLTHGKSWKVRAKGSAYSSLYYRRVKRAVGRADLSLLKGQALHRRYGTFAKNAKDFYDTSYCAGDIVPPSRLRVKCEALLEGQEIRCLALGRLIDFKGVDHSIRAVARAAKSGARVSLDIVGDGPDKDRLVELVRSLDAQPFVRFLGSRPYGPQLLREVASYHLLLFTSLAEETPRSIFDAMAGGCALLAYELPYTRQVTDQCGHGLCVPRADVCELARRLCEFDRGRLHLISLVQRAAESSTAHSAEKWYERRAQWTIEAYERQRSCRRRRGPLKSPGDSMGNLPNSAGRNLRHPL